MKLLVVSDSHGNSAALQRIVDGEKPFDLLVHCGDGITDLERVSLPGDAVIVLVQGNIDRARGVHAETERVLAPGGHRILVTHGDGQEAHRDYLGLIDAAKALRCEAVLFGHTHTAYLSRGNPALFNPGPAQRGQYGVVVAGDTLEFYRKRREEA